MLSVLEELYYGNISPGDRVLAHTEKANAFRKLQRAATPLEEQLIATLNEQQLKQFRTFCDIQGELTQMEQEDLFINAFRLGAKMMAEILLPRNNNLTEKL